MIMLSLVPGLPLLVLNDTPLVWYALLATTGAAYAAGGTAVYAARRTSGRSRGGWVLMAVASLGWAVGNTYWSVNELVVHADVLFPSPADYGYLTFPAAGAIGLWLLSGRSSLGSRVSSVLDGLIVTGSLLAIWWVMTLRAVYEAGGSSRLTFIVSLAYPCGDLVLGTMVFLLATRTQRGGRPVMALLILGLIGMATSDTFFTVDTADASYRSGQLSDVGWLVGFAALAFAAWHSARTPLLLEHEGVQRRWQLFLPYVPFATAFVVTVAQTVAGITLDGVQTATLMAVIALVMARQLVTLVHNSTLTDALRHQAFHDELTGLANRALFTDRLEHALALRERIGKELVVMYLDLDDFKLVNDSLGHDAGDFLLQGVAERLRTCMQPGDTIARLGGDEFAVIVEDGSRPDVQAQRILDAFRRPFVSGSTTVTAVASIGIASTATLPAGSAPTSQDLLKQVDLALYAAKGQGKNTYAVFESPMLDDFDAEMTLRLELARALELGQLRIVHQPIYEIATRRIVGAEALVRWNHSVLGEVPPSTFVPVAERSNLIAPLGEFVLDTACSQFGQWQREDGDYLSVNVSPLQLLDPGFPDTVSAALTRHGMRPSQLVVEVTETVLAEESEIAAALLRLRERGVRIAIDDFGTGYASLRYLHRFPIDIIKIDRSYVTGIEEDADAARLLGTLIHMVSTLDLICVAEGVEHEAQAERLLQLGCPYSQGYLFSRPVDVSQIRAQASVPPPRTATDGSEAGVLRS